ncbi:phosphoribosylglycinamide synthetase C domain-containing protein, partial [Staphylococcus pseudintermedius]
SGLTHDGEHYVTSGGRVILAIGEGATIEAAQQAAYARVEKIESDGLFYRQDIAHKAIKANEY